MFWREPYASNAKSWQYLYMDKYDGSLIPTTITVQEREWRPRWLKWNPFFKEVRRTIEIDFSEEVGKKKGSWKGGVTGCSYELLPDEDPLDCLMRMEKEREF
jgi:hypothetical protein